VVTHGDEHRVPSSDVRARRGLVAGWAVVVVYAALCAAVAVNTARDDRATRGDEAITQFLEAWERYRSQTYMSEAESRRVSRSTGNELPSTLVIAQRPPDRVVRQHGGITGRRDDQVLSCGARPNGGDPTCTLTPGRRTFDESVDREVEILRTYVTGERPAYRVVGEGECFTLVRLRPFPTQFGLEARFCFDERTGATRSTRVDFGDVEVVTEARTIRTTVTDEDLDVGL
jgi:hypothetical protein